MNKKIFSLICAITCALIWGSAFIAQDQGMDYIGPFTFTFGRLFLGFITLIPFLLFFELNKNKNIIFKKKKYFKLSFYRCNIFSWKYGTKLCIALY